MVVGVLGGAANTVAGGGSLLMLPALMLVGLPADVANGTNRVAIVSQSLTGVWSFARVGRLERSVVAPVLVPTLSGALLGAAAAAQVPEEVLRHVLLGTMTAMAVLLTFAPKLVTAADGEQAYTLAQRPAGWVGLFGAGLYGGFVQAGVGFLLLAVLGGTLRYDLARANAVKAVCTLVFGAAALAVFVAAGQVAWLQGLALAAGSVVGSYLGVYLATRVPGRVLQRVLLVAVVASCVAAWLER